ncbi:MAG: metallophosphoesterase [Clostridia bacterium]|nr:metallophosphoesterase [Clostridia bacterium]
MPMRTLFVVSDIHGHYTLLKQALDAAGFDENDPTHCFVCCGDLFDRGRENRRVYHYVQGLKHKILIRGNHDERLLDIINARRVNEYDLYNGCEVTLEEFFGESAVDAYGRLTLPKYGKMAGKLRSLVNSMCDYYETPNYVFTHGWLPVKRENDVLVLQKNWRTADAADWHRARFLEWHLLYGTPAMLSEKTLVCGHRPTRLAARVDPQRSATCHDIFYGDGLIAIDAGTIRSGQVNVLVLNEEIEG